MFGTLGGPELFLILLIALIVFGPRKLPEIGKSMGKMMAEFRKASNEFRQTIENEVEAEKIRDATRIEMPRLDAEPTATNAAPVTPGPEATTTSAPAEPEAPTGAVPETVAAAVSRETTTAVPIEHK
jgi:Tat protein translocase TatB subunit